MNENQWVQITSRKDAIGIDQTNTKEVFYYK